MAPDSIITSVMSQYCPLIMRTSDQGFYKQIILYIHYVHKFTFNIINYTYKQARLFDFIFSLPQVTNALAGTYQKRLSIQLVLANDCF